MIRFDHVFKKYGGARRAWVLDDLSLEIPTGEMVFLLGASGAGKTTLLKLVTLEERPTKGRIQVQEFDSDSIPKAKVPLLRRRCGVVYQDFRLIRDKTIHENLAYVLQMTGILDPNTLHAITRRVLAQVGLIAKRNDFPDELSGGEQQRAAIARALVHQPSILLADEPTGNLDQEMGIDILQLLRRVNLAGATVMVASHDHELALRFADRVIVLEAGRVRTDERIRQKRVAL
ncbi:MAG: ATP-binding cassette domain-containing protein [Candidatus Eisenbacteria bacterium]|uniref:ATP-binding cassette domain-containing protein n=1 Tax=Eiseniibacteriota bacterium TaxID=2212470 RepID=A0A956N8R5_UNCEI|nr:ATP-binding cassette domain-containing protein [Candidatus Eisenbacteria bacterium]MCB9462234.1 ATP-binding cassette domain-containing protein [Candidatus Eisenbacteria bacterium]